MVKLPLYAHRDPRIAADAQCGEALLGVVFAATRYVNAPRARGADGMADGDDLSSTRAISIIAAIARKLPRMRVGHGHDE